MATARSHGSSTTLLSVFAVALAVRVLHVWQMRETLFFSVLMGDSRGYDTWARQIAGGDWIGREVFYQAPLYPYLLGGIYAIFDRDLLVVRLIQALLGACACALLARAASRLFSPGAGLIAGLMLALYPPAIFFDGLIQKSVLDVLILCAGMSIAAAIVSDGDSPRRWLGLGVTLGALALTRENAVVLAAVLCVWALLRARKYAVMFVAGLAAVLLPVGIRNYAVGGGFHLTTSQFGSNLYIGNSPQADGSYTGLRAGRGSPEFERVDATELAEQATGRPLTPSEVSGYWTRQALSYIASEPADWGALLARKARLLISRTEIIDTESQESHAEYSSILQVLGPVWHFGVLLPLAVLGVALTWPDRWRLAPFHALAVAYALSVVAFYVVARYRLPLVPLLVPFAAVAVTRFKRMSVAGLMLAATAAIIANWPAHTAASQQAITENNLGAALQEHGRLDEAIARYRRALTFNPAYSPALNNLGTALRAKGRPEEAVATYDLAIAGGVGASASLYVNRGNALIQQGRTADAVASFRQAVVIDPRSPEAARALANALYDLGTQSLEAGAFAEAESALREAITVRPDYAEARNNLGIAMASQGRLPEAISQWEAALAIDPALQDARRNLELARKQ